MRVITTVILFLQEEIKTQASGVIYSDYRYYEIMADKTEIPFRTEER